jgi:hypothetical protein
MKITRSILALAAAGLLAHSAFGDDNTGTLGFAITQNGHGSYHFQFYQNGAQYDTSVALVTNAGGVAVPLPLQAQEGVLPDEGQTRYVVGTNQHGEANAAYIPLTGNFGPARQ